MWTKITKVNVFIVIALCLWIGKSAFSYAQETVVFDETINWEWPLNTTYDGNGFYRWHYASRDIINLGNMPTDDWKTPADYEDGTFYLRFEILSQPTANEFSLDLGIWQDIGKEGGWSECISGAAVISGGAGAVVETSIGSPSSWWQIRTDAPVDFTRPEDFDIIGLILWKGNLECIPMAQGWSNSEACDDAETQQSYFFPLQARLTIVAVAEGSTFSGWQNYSGGSTRPPTPNYGIDYVNKLTNKVVASTDEYSYSSNMSGAVSGNDQKLALTPGQDVYFRTKAVGETPASLIQTLDVPSLPSAPSFTYDAVNQRTAQGVSAEYEYSDNSNMSGAVTGNGSYVSFSTGTTKYFRKKASSSAFESNIQALLGTSSGPSSNIGPEFVIINDIIEYPNSTDDNGFYFFYYNSSMPVNWLSTYDYFNGQVYTRYEILTQASSEPVGLQFGIWQKLPPETGTLYENMEPIRLLNGPGSVAVQNSSPNTWWTYNGGADLTQMDKVWHFGINPWKVPSNEQIRQENADVWASRFTYWYPMTVRVTVVAVAAGYTFSGWENYLTPETAPDYQIDYANERTSTAVVSTDEYSLNQTSWTSGSGSNLTLTPGQDVYFRKKSATTLVQHLVVPARPAGPSYTIDYAAEKTTQNVPSTVQYASSANFSGAADGAGAQLAITPGATLYFRYKPTASAFTSAATTLVAPARPTITSPTTSPTSISPIPVHVTFPAAVTGFESNDLLVANGSVMSISGTYNVNITPAASGQVIMNVKANAVNEGNFASAAFSIEYAAPTGLEDNEQGMFRLYPTLSESFIILESKDQPGGNYEIFDASGNRIDHGFIRNTKQEISTVRMSPGIYQLVVIRHNKMETFRFIKVKN